MLAKGLPSPTQADTAPRPRVRSSSRDKDLSTSSTTTTTNMHKRFPSNGSIVMPQHLEPLPKLSVTSASHGNLVLVGEMEALEKFDTRMSPPKHKLDKLDVPKSPPKPDHKVLPVQRHKCLQAIAPTPSLVEHAKPTEGDRGEDLSTADDKEHSAAPLSLLEPLDKCIDDKPA
ncbi:hypothetical protein H257_08277 [Aphanomyces astaci]|uniref:Uncharacterized protein n=1 Tax=Aphanomyces astaci TaxID=112090 RepID=W4GFQ2_APHAT|nr:hypothetical protein H257_08277 [Aphanomyces astaci]ETV78066.1 hypothetical protein H257_08277 [Aphanomyces astaci]|eukprot:XP_009832403.1 hypothetical protein H257_08277 [Aphanomyces astaci]